MKSKMTKMKNGKGKGNGEKDGEKDGHKYVQNVRRRIWKEYGEKRERKERKLMTNVKTKMAKELVKEKMVINVKNKMVKKLARKMWQIYEEKERS